MLSRLLSLSPDQKLSFKSNSTFGIARLYNQPNIPSSDFEYWEKYLTVFDSTSDVFSIFSIADIKRSLSIHPDNIRTLILFLFDKLRQLAREDDDFCPVPATPPAHHNQKQSFSGWLPNININININLPSASRINNNSNSEKDQESIRNLKTKQALNCIRLLTRLIPIILEGDQPRSSSRNANPNDSNSFQKQLFWTERVRSSGGGGGGGVGSKVNSGLSAGQQSGDGANGDEDRETEDQFVIQDEDEELESESAANSPNEVLKDPLGATSKQKPDEPKDQEKEDQNQTSTTTSTLAQDLILLTLDLLFYSGFTISWTDEHVQFINSSTSTSFDPSKTRKTNPLIWYTGIGSTTPLPIQSNQSRYFTENRIEVLRLLLILLSKSMYVEPQFQFSPDSQNLNLKFLVCETDRDRVLKLLCSSLNLVGKLGEGGIEKEGENWNLTSIGAGIGIGNGNVNKDSNSFMDLITLSLQILNVLLNFDPLPTSEAGNGNASSASSPKQSLSIPSPTSFLRSNSNESQSSLSHSSSKPSINLFKYYLSKLHLTKDFNFLFDSLITILNLPFNSSMMNNLTTLLPSIQSNFSPSTSSSMSQNPHLSNSSESLLLFWKLITDNKKFRNWLVESKEKSQIILGQLLNYSLYSKDSTQLSGLIRLSIFILQDLSSSDSFSSNISLPNSLNETRKNISSKNLKSIIINSSNNNDERASDLMIQIIYSLIATTKSSLSNLYTPLILILSNTSKDFKKLSIKSSNHLLSLFKSFSNPFTLLSDENNPRILFFLLETFNNIIRFGARENLNVIYTVLKNKNTFEKLERFSLRNGLIEIRRLRGLSNNSSHNVRIGVDNRVGALSSSTSDINLNGNDTVFSAEDEKSFLGKRDQEESERLERENRNRNQNHDQDQDRVEEVEKQENEIEIENQMDPLSKVQTSERTKGKMRKISITTLDSIPDSTTTTTNQSSNTTTSTSTSTSTSSSEPKIGDELNDTLIQDLNEEELYQAAETIGRNGFVATERWVNSWQKDLPLETIKTLLNSLAKPIEDFSTSENVANKTNADDRVLAFLRELNWDQVLKKKGEENGSEETKVQIRPFIHNPQSKIWILSYLWGLIYLTNLYPLGIFSNTNARLFLLKNSNENNNPSGLTGGSAGQFVGQILEGLGGFINFSSGNSNVNRVNNPSSSSSGRDGQ